MLLARFIHCPLLPQVPDDLTITVMPGVSPAEPGSSVTKTTRLYDDDGSSIDYEDGAFYWTAIGCTWAKAASSDASDTLSCTVSPPEGAGFAGFPKGRKYAFRFPGTWAPASVSLAVGSATSAGVTAEAVTPVTFDPYGHPDATGEDAAWQPGAATWSYEGQTLSTWVRLDAPMATDLPFTITLAFPAGARLDDGALTSGFYRKVQRALSCKMEYNDHYGIVFPSDVEMLLNVTGAPARLEALAGRVGGDVSPDAAKRLITSSRKLIRSAISFMSGWRVPANMSFTGAWQRCLGGSYDALTGLVEVPEPDEAIDFRKYEQVRGRCRGDGPVATTLVFAAPLSRAGSFLCPLFCFNSPNFELAHLLSLLCCR